MKTPLVSVIIPVYNQEKWIGRCLRSLLNQTMNRDEYELVVIDDGSEDPDHDGLNRTSLLNKYCKSHDDPSSSDCNINPNTPDGALFYKNLENFTNFEEFENGTNPISNDTDGDEWDDGPEVFYQDHDNDGMATGWEFYFEFDPMDSVDRNIDSDGDGHVNYCEYKWDTNPRDPVSYPGQGQTCDWYNE